MPVVRESETVAPSGEPGLELPDGSSAVCKPKYKHVPHRLKPAPVVERRNARERKRVEGVNSAFTKLRALIPYKNRHKRLSKVKTLNIAIDYIRSLEQVLKDDELISSPSPTSHAPAYYDSAMSSPASVTSSVTWESDGPYPDQVSCEHLLGLSLSLFSFFVIRHTVFPRLGITCLTLTSGVGRGSPQSDLR